MHATEKSPVLVICSIELISEECKGVWVGVWVRESTVVLLMATEHWDTVRVHQQRAGRQRWHLISVQLLMRVRVAL